MGFFFRKQAHRNWLWLIIGCVLSLPLAEGVTRLQAHIYGEDSPENIHYVYNALGLRGPMPNPKIPALQRVAFIGDSVAMGWHVAEPHTLRARLADRLGPNSDVITTGFPGLNLDEAVTRWLSYRQRIPSVGTVVLVATIRATGRSVGKPQVRPSLLNRIKFWLKHHSLLCAELTDTTWYRRLKYFKPGQGMGDAPADAYLPTWRNPAHLRTMEQALNRLQADQKKHHYRVIILVMPDLYSFHPYRAEIMHETMQREARERGWIYIDPKPAMNSHPARYYRVAPYDIHPNPKAIRIMTDQLMRAFPGSGHG